MPYLPQEKRYDYNVHNLSIEQADPYLPRHSYSTHAAAYKKDYINDTSPINRRRQLNQSMNQAKIKRKMEAALFEQNQPKRQIVDMQGRVRANSSSNYKKSQISQSYKPGFQQFQADNRKKKVYFGRGDNYGEEFQSIQINKPNDKSNNKFNLNSNENNYIQNTRKEDKYPSTNEKRMYQSINKEQQIDRQQSFKQNVNSSNLKRQNHNEKHSQSKARVKNNQENMNGEATINEKQIMDKIERINKLNEEINSRLQRMLSKLSSNE